MQPDFDVIVIGSGPAGVSVSCPLAEAGVKTLMVDGGYQASLPPPSRPFLEERAENAAQWKWFVGEDFHALRRIDAISPKFRVPTHAYVFRDFLERNRIAAGDYVAVGSLAKGGLSNAWGCGVARYSAQEFASFPFPESEILPSYAQVARRIGLSGRQQDDLADYFGVDDWAEPALPMDPVHERLFGRYAAKRPALERQAFRLGRARLAVLGRDAGNRKACDLSGNCLWGCSRGALYSASDEIAALESHASFTYRSGFVVGNIRQGDGHVVVEGKNAAGAFSVTARQVVLAAGTLATTRLAAAAIGNDQPMRLQACPTAAFLLWAPDMMGGQRQPGFGLGQLSFSLGLAEGVTGFGSTFSPTGIPVTEFVRHLPLRTRYGIDVLRHLLGACLVGNLFLPGHLSAVEARLDAAGALQIAGGYSERVPELMALAATRLRRAFRQLGVVLVPMSFSIGRPGSDIHYAGSLPMRDRPVRGETTRNGEVAGFANLFVADGACLSALSEKSHTLTIMANADRIGRGLAQGLRMASGHVKDSPPGASG